MGKYPFLIFIRGPIYPKSLSNSWCLKDPWQTLASKGKTLSKN